jgi:CheY-like chemotaxis protein
MAAPRILVVEDEEPLARILSFSFENEGYVVSRARDGVECMNRVTMFQPDVILMDLMMPKLDGVETIRLLRSNEQNRHLLIVALTAKARNEDREEALTAGADVFVKKPFQISLLLDHVNDLLGSRRMD